MEIIPRSEWGAIYARGFGVAPLPASEVWLHHSVTIAPNLVPPFDDDKAAVRTLERIGQQRFGGGISYTFAVTPVGLVFEGHGVDRQGSHTGGRNSIARAICLIGDYSSNPPTLAQKKSVAELLVHGWKQGWWRNPKLNGGHRDAPSASTSCPGNAAHASIPEINRLTAQLAVPIISTPKEGLFMHLSEAEEREILAAVRDIRWKEKTTLDYTVHGGGNKDDQYGHTLSVRKLLKSLSDRVDQLTALIIGQK
jgi:hypothetical protein